MCFYSVQFASKTAALLVAKMAQNAPSWYLYKMVIRGKIKYIFSTGVDLSKFPISLHTCAPFLSYHKI